MIDVSLFAFGFTHHRKVRRLCDAAFRLWVTAIDHANQDRSGGLVTPDDIDCYPRAPRDEFREAAIAELVTLGLWVPTEGGWLIHDFDEWQSRPAEHQPARPAVTSRTPAGSPSQLGGVARAAGAKRGPGGRFGPSRTPAGIQPNSPAEHQPAGDGGAACFPPDPLSDRKDAESLGIESTSGISDQPESKGSPSRRRTRLPAGWSPTEEHAARASREGVSLAAEVERFRLHAESTGRVMANWNAAFTTWLINAPRFAPRGGARGPVQPSHGQNGFRKAHIVR
jgi:hypothetical protein